MGGASKYRCACSYTEANCCCETHREGMEQHVHTGRERHVPPIRHGAPLDRQLQGHWLGSCDPFQEFMEWDVLCYKPSLVPECW